MTTRFREGAPALIEMKLSSLAQLFNSMDPSPFHERDLDRDAEAFIVSWAQEHAKAQPFKLVIHLAKLIGPGNWIVPGQSEKSRFFQVVIFPDEIPGAMPPTGHGIGEAEVEVLRQWIVAGAPMPEGRNERLRPLGEAPRSR